MFTPAVFKEVLLPIFNDSIENFAVFPLKNSQKCDFLSQISNSLLECGFDPSSYAVQIQKFNQLRHSCLPQTTGISSEMFHYFIELENISYRMSISSTQSITFSWTDAFNSMAQGTQSSLAFEKASVLYNIASKILNNGVQNLSLATLKASVKTFCTSATILDWVSNNFVNAPTQDIGKEMSKFLCSICLLQAQEAAFFQSIQEEKNLKILARLSLGVTTMLITVQNSIPHNLGYDFGYFMHQLERKTCFHNFVHCLVMAEFWNHQELFEISHDLYKSCSDMLDRLDIQDKCALQDHLKIAMIRTEKEKDQIAYEGKDSRENREKVEPYVIATILDFKNILLPYASTYSSLFTGIYPISIIELQSLFEDKVRGMTASLQHQITELESQNDLLIIKKDMKLSDFLLQVREYLLKSDLQQVKSDFTEMERSLIDVENSMKLLQIKYPSTRQDQEYFLLMESYTQVIREIETHRIKLVLNDPAYVQTLFPILNEKFSTFITEFKLKVDELRPVRSNCLSALQNLEAESKMTDIKESALAAENKDTAIENAINRLDPFSLKTIKEYQCYKDEYDKVHSLWQENLLSSSKDVEAILPGVVGIPTEMKKLNNNISDLETRLEGFVSEKTAELEVNSSQSRRKLLELINKYE